VVLEKEKRNSTTQKHLHNCIVFWQSPVFRTTWIVGQELNKPNIYCRTSAKTTHEQDGTSKWEVAVGFCIFKIRKWNWNNANCFRLTHVSSSLKPICYSTPALVVVITNVVRAD